MHDKNLESHIDTPILLIGFNRPEYSKELIASLRKFQPKKIYFAVDGPRANRLDDRVKVFQVQGLINLIDWPCEVRTKFSEVNLGCKWGPISAINWIFETEEQAIILEDDIRPNESFFKFCEENLKRYSSFNDVFFIAGSNFLVKSDQEFSYRFASVFYVWGWATWKRAWREYSPDLSSWQKDVGIRGIRRHFGCSWIQAFILGNIIFRSVAKNRIQTWDYQLVYFAIKSKKLAVNSNVNLTENVGFGKSATHTLIKPDFLQSSNEIEFPLISPPHLRDAGADLWMLNNAYGLVSYKKYFKNIFCSSYFYFRDNYSDFLARFSRNLKVK